MKKPGLVAGRALFLSLSVWEEAHSYAHQRDSRKRHEKYQRVDVPVRDIEHVRDVDHEVHAGYVDHAHSRFQIARAAATV